MQTFLYLPTLASNVDVGTEVALPAFRAFFERMSAFSSVVLFDRRGTGVSDGVPGRIAPTLEDWADDALAVLDALDLERVSLLAHGLGVAPALLFAAAHPSRVQSVVLIQGFARLTSAAGYEISVPASLADRLVANVADSWGEGSSFFWANPGLRHDTETREVIARAERGTFGRAAATRAYAAWLSIDVRHVVPSVEVPVLVIQGTGSRSPTAAGRWLAKTLPNAQLLEHPGENLDWWVLDACDVAIAAIEEFVTGAVSASGLCAAPGGVVTARCP